MKVLLDTDVRIDCLRGSAAAREWLERSSEESFQVPGVVAMELLWGCRNRGELDRIHHFLSSFNVIWPEASEFARAYELLGLHRLSSGLNIPDCLIAAMALARGARLYTFNLKHFGVVSGLEVQQPYSRS
jgi:predicted nucleic acid-binding protein